MFHQRSSRVYRETAAQTASPGQLVLMLFDGALRFLNVAAKGFDEADLIRRNEQIHNNLFKVQAILTELQVTLNREQGGEFADTMYRLYDFMKEQLREANHKKEPHPIPVVQDLLTEIRDAWAEMLQQQTLPSDLSRLAVAG